MNTTSARIREIVLAGNHLERHPRADADIIVRRRRRSGASNPSPAYHRRLAADFRTINLLSMVDEWQIGLRRRSMLAC